MENKLSKTENRESDDYKPKMVDPASGDDVLKTLDPESSYKKPKTVDLESGDKESKTVDNESDDDEHKTVDPVESNGDESSDDSLPSDLNFEKSLMFNMIGLKPAGIHKHLNMLLLREKMSEDLNFVVPTNYIWKNLETKWNIQAADVIEGTSFDKSDQDFSLPDEYKSLIAEEGEKILKFQEKESLSHEITKDISTGRVSGSKSNSLSSIDLKDDLDEIDPLKSNHSLMKTHEFEVQKVPITQRAMHTDDKSEAKEPEDNSSKQKNTLHINISSDELKSKDLKQSNKQTLNQSKGLEKNAKVSVVESSPKKRIHSDLLIIQQSPDAPLGRRSSISSSKKTSKD